MRRRRTELCSSIEILHPCFYTDPIISIDVYLYTISFYGVADVGSVVVV